MHPQLRGVVSTARLLASVIAVAVLVLVVNACSFIERLNGEGHCDYPAIRNLRTVYNVGDTVSLDVGLRDAGNAPVTCLGSIAASWSSEQAAVASVTPAGFLTALQAGTTVLTTRTSYGSVRTEVRVVVPSNAVLALVYVP